MTAASARKGLRDRAEYPAVYMFAVTLVFTAILVGLARGTQERVEANRRIRFERAVLRAAGLDAEGDVHRVFTERLEAPSAGTGGAYVYRAADGKAVYALPFEGQGFWDVIKGVIGLDADGETVRGIAFYEQRETPGLGAEITTPAFRGRFEGLGLKVGARALALVPAGTPAEAGEVHAITGATQTCTRLEKILNDAIAAWRAAAGDMSG
ncbi:MAG: FMN-binding protein [Lentisphaerae bacterium]|nr:FMN-binding protein [Lentisphaerota bacterium]